MCGGRAYGDNLDSCAKRSRPVTVDIETDKVTGVVTSAHFRVVATGERIRISSYVHEGTPESVMDFARRSAEVSGFALTG